MKGKSMPHFIFLLLHIYSPPFSNFSLFQPLCIKSFAMEMCIICPLLHLFTPFITTMITGKTHIKVTRWKITIFLNLSYTHLKFYVILGSHSLTVCYASIFYMQIYETGRSIERKFQQVYCGISFDASLISTPSVSKYMQIPEHV